LYLKQRVVKPDYIQACVSKQSIVEEAPYECYSDSSDLGRMARFWRKTSVRPYTDWKVVIRLDSSKYESFCRVIRAGNGNIVELDMGASLCILDKKQCLIKCTEKRVDSAYVVEYLTSLGSVNVDGYLL
jgi:hypothetical protein